jgi:ABC-type amino acid transport system permease subunit
LGFGIASVAARAASGENRAAEPAAVKRSLLVITGNYSLFLLECPRLGVHSITIDDMKAALSLGFVVA